MISAYESILSLMRNYLVEDNELLLCDNLDELIELANKLSVSPIISFVLNKHNIKGYELPALTSYRKYLLQQKEKKQLCELLDANNIEYTFIKGSDTCKYYKDPYLRIGSDIDVVVQKKDYKNVYDLLINKGCICTKTFPTECCMQLPSGILIDLHFVFISNNETISNYLFTKVNSTHELDIDDAYILLIAHSEKHFIGGLLDLRNMSDIYYMKPLIKDNKYVENILKENNLFKFENAFVGYLEELIGKKEKSEFSKIMDEFIMNRINGDGAINSIAAKLAAENILKENTLNSKFSFLINRIFVPVNVMHKLFPNSKKHKILLPLYYIYRPFKRLTQDGINTISRELKLVDSIELNKVDEYSKLYEELGINE